LNGYSWEKSTRDGEESAKAHMALLRELDYPMDFLKVTPYYRFMAIQWGSNFRFEDNDEEAPTVEVAVKKTEDWERLWVLDPRKELREFVRCNDILARDLRRMPFIYTIPSPIIQAMNGVSTSDQVRGDMKENPDALRQGLETITDTTIDFEGLRRRRCFRHLPRYRRRGKNMVGADEASAGGVRPRLRQEGPRRRRLPDQADAHLQHTRRKPPEALRGGMVQEVSCHGYKLGRPLVDAGEEGEGALRR
jgi:hypothetical protein